MKKKGFTLIELLAVIVILAIIALISTPTILNVIEKSRRTSAIESVNGILDTAEKYQFKTILDENETNEIIDLTSNTLTYKGSKPESGTLIIGKKGNMSIIAKYGNYCIEKKFTDDSPNIIDKENCKIDSSEFEYAFMNESKKSLNGIDEYINLGFENYEFGNSLTFAIRARMYPSEVSKNRNLMGNWEAGGGGIFLSKSNRIVFELFGKSGAKYFQVISPTSVNSGQMYTYVGTCDGETLKLYIDGQLVRSVSFNDTIKAPKNTPIVIGANPAPNLTQYANFLKIDVYESAIFGRALTEDEIKNNYSKEFHIENKEDLLDYKNFQVSDN